MARKSNKTDHVLNLLSSGNKKKGNDGGADKSAPPVQLKKKSNDEPDLEITESVEDKPETDDIELGNAAIHSTEPVTVTSEENRGSEASVSTGTEIPEVSVVQAGGDENPIADAVRDSLEAELGAYLKEEEEGHSASLLEEKENTVRGADTESLPDLSEYGAGADRDTEPGTGNDLPDLPDHTLRQQESPAEAEHDMEVVEQDSERKESAGNTGDDLPGHVINTAAEVLNRQETGTVPGHISNQPVEKSIPVGKDTQIGRNELSSNTEEAPSKLPEKKLQRETPVQQPATENKEQENISRGETIQKPLHQETAGHADSVQTVKEPELQPKAEESKQDGQKEEDVDYTIVNVMEHLVRGQAPKYIRQFGHCDCRRCIEDTVALALTHLPPKYVVVNKAAASPLLNFYEKRFAGQLIVEITKASMIIHENPHHQI